MTRRAVDAGPHGYRGTGALIVGIVVAGALADRFGRMKLTNVGLAR